MQEQPFDTFGTNNCVKISDHTYFSPDHLGGTAMTLRHMKIFVAVYQQKSITLASNRLHLAQPSVSLAIKELEEYYHIRLFDRLSRRIYPTENGHRFYEYALHIVSLFSEMENKIPAWDANAPLHIGSSITLGTCLLPSLVKAYQEQHPEIKIYVTVKNTGTIEQAVVDNQLDFALVEGTVTHPEIISEVFSADTLCMVAAPAHPLAANRTVTLADAASCPLLLREPGSAGREIVESLFLSGGIQIAPAWESVSTLALIRAAQNGLGIAILPELLVRDALKSGDLVSLPLPPDILTRSLYLIRHRNKYLSSSAEEFLNLCRMWKF